MGLIFVAAAAVVVVAAVLGQSLGVYGSGGGYYCQKREFTRSSATNSSRSLSFTPCTVYLPTTCIIYDRQTRTHSFIMSYAVNKVHFF